MRSLSSRPSRGARLLGAVAGAVALCVATACGASAPDAPAGADPHAGMPGMTGPAPAGHGDHSMPGMGSDVVQLFAVQSGSLGVVVTDGSGRLLYGSDRDMTNPSMSMCTGTCAQEWQPIILAAGEQPELSGVDAAKVGRSARDDGSSQLTLGGWPAYVNRDDDGSLSGAAAGAHGAWFAMTPTGTKVPV